MAARTGLPLITRLPPRRRPWWPRAAVFLSRQAKAKRLKYRGFSRPPGLRWKAFGRTWPASTAWCRRSIKGLAKEWNDTTFELPLGGAWSGPIGGTGRLIPLIIGRDGAREGQRVTNNNTPSGRQLALGNETKQSSAIARRSQWWRRWRGRRSSQQAAAPQSQSSAQSPSALCTQRARRPAPRPRPPGVRQISGAGPRGGDVGRPHPGGGL